MFIFLYDIEKGFGDGFDYEEKYLFWVSYLGEILYWILNLKILYLRRFVIFYLFFDVFVIEMLYNYYSFYNFKLSY